jgi:hypothetical protein
MVIAGMKMKRALLAAACLACCGTALAALTTEDLTRLKASGLGEGVIRFMVESGYADVDRVLKLKEAGFSDETISAVVRSDLKGGGKAAPQPTNAASPRPAAEPAAQAATQPAAQAADEVALLRTSAQVKIEQYLVRGEPVVKNSQDIPGATVTLLEGRRLKIEWDASKVPANFFRRKPFTSPFYWDLDKSDGMHGVSQKDNSFVLRTGHAHQGLPAADKAHAWVVHVTPGSPELAKRIGALLAE